MKNKSVCLCLLAVIAVSLGKLSAQTSTNLDGAGYINLTPGSTWAPTSFSGKTFFWWPSKGALRFGDFTRADSQSIADIGTDSIGGGWNAIAKGSSSVAFGRAANAFGASSLALGQLAHAVGSQSIAVGFSTSNGIGSTAIGGGTTDGNYSIALGGESNASGYSSVALGSNSNANGGISVAIGYGTTYAQYSTAIGPVTANAYGGVAVGLFNLGTKKDGSLPTTPSDVNVLDPTDPIFEVGNGSGAVGPTHTSGNALTVFRDGTVRLSKASGGISMGQFN